MGQTNHNTLEQGKPQTWIWLLLSILMVTLCISWAIFAGQVTQLEKTTEGLNYIEYMNSGAQRLVRLEMTGNPSDEIIFTMESALAEITPAFGTTSEYFMMETHILDGIVTLNEDWNTLKEEIALFRAYGQVDHLLSTSERHFYHVSNLANDVIDLVTQLSNTILLLQNLMMLQLAIISIIIGHQVWRTLKILKHNHEVAASMFIDTATGLFNRSKCQEILRMDFTNQEQKSRALVVFDLNDLKKTNDLHGHRTGDDLIHNFAKIIREATTVHNFDAFVGRYGGDEFIVYYNYISEYDLKLYLDEVDFQADHFNNQEEKYQISFATGYAMSSDAESKTMRHLFDCADERMYKNKIAMKEKRRLETGEVGPR
ncbi:MAG: GGDEF domain-containing protein [Eubacteriales bacterium]